MLFLEEKERLVALENLDRLGASDQKEFDEIASLARLISLTKFCLITLMGKENEFFLSVQGIPPDAKPSSYSLCRYAMRGPASLTSIDDLAADAQLRTNPLVVGEPFLRFYAGVPLLGRNRQLLGTLCVLDEKPNHLTEHQIKALRILGNRAVKLLEYGKILTDQRTKMDATFDTLQMIVSQSPQVLLTIDRDFIITFANRADTSLREELIGRPITEFIEEESKQPFIDACRQCANTGEVVSGNYKCLTNDKQQRWYMLKVCPLKDRHGVQHNFLVIGQDKTTQKLQEQQLREQDNRYRDIVENTTDMIVTVDINGVITYVNRSWIETIGVANCSEVIGKNVFDYIHHEGMPAAAWVFEMMREGHERIQIEMVWQTTRGEKVICDANIDCGYVDGKIAYQRGIFRNITEQKLQKLEMQKKQLMLTEAQKISRTGNVEVNFETGEVKWSDEMYNILETDTIRPGMLISELYEMVIETDQEKATKYIESVQDNPTTSHLSFRIVTPKGNLKYLDCNGSPFLKRDGKVIVMMFTLQDVTEIRQFEKKMFTAVVESEERERTRMAGELHDGVCQYLASAGIMIDALKDKLRSIPETASNTQIEQLISLTRNSVREGLNLVRKVSHDLFPLEFYKSGLICSVNDLVKTLNHSGEIFFNLELRGNYVETDPSISINLFRIIQEFTRNSQKYSGATQVTIRINSSREMVKLTISDNGKGFDMDRVAESHKGFGLLSMKKRIESIGGRFSYKSTPGSGVQLRLKVPLGH